MRAPYGHNGRPRTVGSVMTVTFVDNGEYLRWTTFDSEEFATGYLWDPGMGWGTWEDRGDRVVRARRCDEAEVPAEFREAFARSRYAEA